MNVADLLAVTAVDVHVIVVTFLVLLDEVREAAQNVLLGDGVEEADQVVVQEHEVVRDILLGPVGGEELMNFRHRRGVVGLPKYSGHVVSSMC